MLVISALPPRVLRRIHWLLYVFVLLSHAVVLVVGTSVQGGQRWINLGAVPVPALGVRQAAADRGPGGAPGRAARRHLAPGRLTLMALAYMALPALLVFAEPDFGTALVYAAVTLGILFVLGAPWRHFAWMGLVFAVAMAMVFSILPGRACQVLKPYQQDRLTAFLHPTQPTRRATATT